VQFFSLKFIPHLSGPFIAFRTSLLYTRTFSLSILPFGVRDRIEQTYETWTS